MQKLSKNQKLVIIILITLALNVIYYSAAYPETFKPENATFARDFSAYYIGEWRLIHNPTQVYYGGSAEATTEYSRIPNPSNTHLLS